MHSASAQSSVKHCASLGEVCLSTVHSPVKKLLVRGEWIEGGNGKWSQLFPFPQPVYGNIMGARLSSHGGGKDSGNKSERTGESEGGTDREKGGGIAEMLLLAVFSGKDLALCVSFIVWFSLWQRP